MKRLLILMCVLLFLAPNIDARKKIPKSGEIQDGVFTDAQHGFKLTLPEDWKAKRWADKYDFRLTLMQRKYGIPTHYQAAEDYTLVPRIVVYVGESAWSPDAFIDSLLSDSYKSDQKKNIQKEFDFLAEQKIIPKGRKMFEVDGLKGFLWKGQAKYMKAVTTSASSVGGKRVNSSYGGSIAAIKNGDKMLVFHVMCEWEFFEPVFNAALETINSLDWGTADAEPKK